LEEVNDLNVARRNLAGVGTNTLALAFAGNTPSATGLTESWDGTNWINVGDLNTTRVSLAGAGTNTAALGFGGEALTAATEEWYGDGKLTETFTTS